MRKWARKVAHNKMKKAGFSRVNKHKTGNSFFSENWRDFVKK